MQWIKHLLLELNKLLDTWWSGAMVLLISVGSFLTLTLTRLTASSIWFDEAYSSYLVRFNLTDLTSYTAVDVHPPFYYYCLKLWTNLFGSSPAAIRAMSVVLGVLVIILVFILVKRLFNYRSASLAAALLAISPMFVRYGIEARMYMLVIVIALLATMVFLRLMETNRLRYCILYGLLISLGMWTHYFMITVWLAHWVYRLFYLRLAGLRRGQLAKAFFSRNWLVAHGLAVALFIPWLPVLLKQLANLSGGFWIPPITVNTLGDYLTNFFMYLESSKADGWLAVFTVVAAAWLVKVVSLFYRQADQNKRNNLLLVLSMAVTPVLMLMVLSLYPLKSMFVDRYLMPAIVFLTILIAVCLAGVRQRGCLTSGLLVLVGGMFIYGLTNVYQLGNYNRYSSGPDRNSMTGEIVELVQRQSSAPIISTQSYGYYEAAASEDHARPVYFLWNMVKDSQVGSLKMLRDNKLGRGITDLDSFTTEHQEVWLIGSNDQDKIAAPAGSTGWRVIRTISVADLVSGNRDYKATLYKVK